MEERLLKNGESKAFYSKNELQEYLKFRKEHDKWATPYMASEVGVVGLDNLPLLLPGLCKDIVIKKTMYELKTADIDPDAEEVQECLSETGLFIAFPLEGKMVTKPSTWNAYGNLLMRTDDYCGTMNRFDPKTNKKVLPIDEKAARINRDLELYGDICKILYRDCKVQAVLSKEYVVLPADELVSVLEEKLAYEHPNMEFTEGSVCEEFLIACYELNNRAIEEEIRLKLNDTGININTLKAGVQFSTSDIGLSSVTADIYFICDGTKIFLNGIRMPHKGNETSVALFSEKLDSFGEALKDAEEMIERLGNIEVSDVAGTVREVTEHFSSVFPNKVTSEVLEELELQYKTGGTGIDVYMALNDIVNRHAQTNNLTPVRYLQLTEQVTKLMKLPFDRIDAGEYSW